MGSYRITVDTGGTFSDFVYLEEKTGEVTIAKVPSTPEDPSRAILAGIERLLSRGVTGDQIAFFCHGTTVGTNALLEGKGATTGLLVTKGFRGIYEVGEQSRPHGPAIFDVMYQKPAMLVLPSRTGEVAERVAFDGTVLEPLDEAGLRQTVRQLGAEQIESIAVCLLFSFLHPEHEARVGRIIAEELPAANISLSSEIVPQIREYYRLSTTVINAYLQPILARYIDRLGQRLGEAGIHTRAAYIMQSNGGMATFGATAKKAVTTVLSGPAGGVTAGVATSRMIARPNIITFDMGGTSCDVALIRDGAAIIANHGKVEGRDLAVPMMDINTVSAGGGTVAVVDRFGELKVGPQSAGAVPGPACYGRGGTLPTITDCNLVLGLLSEDNFLGGRMRLDRAKAWTAIETAVAKPLGLDVIEAAAGIVRIINVKMEEAIKAISTIRGHDLREFWLLPFGGAGPIHAGAIADNLDMAGLVVPLYPGVFSAIGLLMSDVKHDYIRSRLTPFATVTPADINSVFERLEKQARDDLAAEGFDGDRIRIARALDMRYAGQGYELTIPVAGGSGASPDALLVGRSGARPDALLVGGSGASPDALLVGRSGASPDARWFGRSGASPDAAADLVRLRARFDATHQQQFGHAAPDEVVEIVSWRLQSTGLMPPVETRRFEPAGASLEDALRERRPVWFAGPAGGAFHDTPIYQRERLDVGHRIPGPVVVEQYDCTIVIEPGQQAHLDSFRNLIVERRR